MAIGTDGVVLKDVTIVSLRLERMCLASEPIERRGVVVLRKAEGSEFEIDLTEDQWSALVDWVAEYEVTPRRRRGWEV